MKEVVKNFWARDLREYLSVGEDTSLHIPERPQFKQMAVARIGGSAHMISCTADAAFSSHTTTTRSLSHTMTSTITFPVHTTDQIETMSSISVLSRQATALEICDMVYGNKTPSWEAIEHHYESSASESLALMSLGVI